MDTNQPAHYRIEVYDAAPPPAKPRRTTLCPGGRHLSRPRLVLEPEQVQCRRCRELLNVIGIGTSGGDTPF